MGDSTVRYTALYRDLRGRQRSAGTFSTERQADRAWQRAEARLAEGRVGDPRRGRQTFRAYVEGEWLPNHLIEASTRQGYRYVLDKHLLPELGPMRMAEILPSHVRELVTQLQAAGASAHTIAKCRSILNAIFTTALNDQIIFLHPCKGVKTPPVPAKPLEIVTPEQFDLIYAALPDAQAQLLVETAIESGLRWGELIELRVRDLEFTTGILTVSRTVVELTPKHHPGRGRFLVKDYPKDREFRRLKLGAQLVAKIKAHIAAGHLGADNLLFTAPMLQASPHLVAVPDPDALGRTEPNAAGRRYRHGTLTGYSLGRCRCQQCRAAYALYRAKRRAEGKDDPRPGRTLDTDGHIPRAWFRTSVWRPALQAAGIDRNIRMRDLRHAHASWLLAGGADLQVVKERLGHGSIRTTERYLHTLPNADDTALKALRKVRKQSGR